MKRIAIVLMLTACSSQLAYIPEPEGQDHWQTPLETIKRGGGDCEDLAIEYWSRHQDQWLVQGTADDVNHVWVEDGKGNITFTSALRSDKHVPVVYFNRQCYHMAGKEGCGNARHIIKWDNVLILMEEHR